MTIKTIQEGNTKLSVPSPEKYLDPAHGPVFYNPKMEFDRSLSVRVINECLDKGMKIADILTGTGARAVRYANEGKNFKIWANDAQPSAIKMCEKNAKLNKVKVKTSVDEANHFLLENKREYFDCIDIDPFGSPIHFVLNAGKAIKPKNSLLCVTATDTGSLSGSFPKACYRKYGFNVEKTSMQHEIGIRGLIGAVFRELAKHDLSIEPQLAYTRLHYYRAFLKVVPGTKRTNRGIKKLSYLSWCPKCDRRELTAINRTPPTKCKCDNEYFTIGPIWNAELGDRKLAAKVNDGSRLLNTLKDEIAIPYIHYNLHYMAKKNKTNCPKLETIMEKLEKKGYRVSRTHYNNNGIVTNADYESIVKALKN